MKASVLLGFVLAGCSFGTPSTQGTSTGATSGQDQSAGSSTGAGPSGSITPTTGASTGTSQVSGSVSPTTGSSGSGTASGTTSGAASGSGSGTVVASGSTSGAASGTGGDDDGGVPETGTIVLSDAGINAIPAGYTGKPFTVPAGHAMTIPGTIHLADYDLGGVGNIFCHTNVTPPTAAACGGFNFNDWRPAGTPIYRPVPAGDTSGTCNAAACDDNAGLCHMNSGEPDDDPTGKPIVPADVYPCYTATGEWIKYTVQVLESGTYSVGGLMGAPRPPQNDTPTVSLDFGTVNGTDITTGVFTVPSSICGMPDPGCTEGYHVWQTDNNMAMVTFPAPGTYVMTFNLVTSYLNPDYFVFTKM
jgi:hypothetical protein